MSFYQYELDTKMGPMITVANESNICLLEFSHSSNLKSKLARNFSIGVEKSKTKIISQLHEELDRYFEGDLTNFTAPFELRGSAFQKRVWHKLLNIKFGQTLSYKELAESCDLPKGYRAVANANAANMIAVIVPCHRVIASDGNLGGYAGGIQIKKRLLELESKNL